MCLHLKLKMLHVEKHELLDFVMNRLSQQFNEQLQFSEQLLSLKYTTSATTTIYDVPKQVIYRK